METVSLYVFYVILKEVMAFQQDTIVDVRKLVIAIMEEAWLVGHTPGG